MAGTGGHGGGQGPRKPGFGKPEKKIGKIKPVHAAAGSKRYSPADIRAEGPALQNAALAHAESLRHDYPFEPERIDASRPDSMFFRNSVRCQRELAKLFFRFSLKYSNLPDKGKSNLALFYRQALLRIDPKQVAGKPDEYVARMRFTDSELEPVRKMTPAERRSVGVALASMWGFLENQLGTLSMGGGSPAANAQTVMYGITYARFLWLHALKQVEPTG